MCVLFGKSKQAYFKSNDNATLHRLARETFAIQYIKDVRKKDPGIGGLKLWHMYKRDLGENNTLGRDKFYDIIDANGFKLRDRLRKPRTTDSSHGLPVFKNLVKEFIPTKPNQLWVSDITYITICPSDEKYYFCYLSLILDSYTEEIVGWSLGPSLSTQYPVEALRMALSRIKDQHVSLIHHSDRGCQYASKEYVSLLTTNDVKISMTENGDPKENATAERINNTMKNELLRGKTFHNIDEAREAIRMAIDFYNNERPHMSIGMLTPSEAATREGELPSCWVSKKEEYIKKLQEKNGTSLDNY